MTRLTACLICQRPGNMSEELGGLVGTGRVGLNVHVCPSGLGITVDNNLTLSHFAVSPCRIRCAYCFTDRSFCCSACALLLDPAPLSPILLLLYLGRLGGFLQPTAPASTLMKR
jgi:hypothetical protein